MDVGDHSCPLRGLDKRDIIERRFDAPEAGLGEPNPMSCKLLKILFSQPRLEQNITAIDAHTAWALIVPAFFGGDRESLDAGRITPAARHMDLRSGNRCQCATV